MTIPVGDIVRVTANMTFGTGEALQNVWHVLSEAGTEVDQLVLDGIMGMLEDCYTELLPFMANNVTFIPCPAYHINQDRSFDPQPWPTLTVGGATGEYLPNGVALLNIARTGFSKIFGRKYFGGFTETHLQDGLFVTSAVQAAVDAVEWCYGSYVAANGWVGQAVVYSRASGTFKTVTTDVSYAIPAYQRRRRPGVGI